MLGASANAGEIDSEFSLGYANEYIFRGIDFGDDLYEFSLDFSGTGYCDFDWNAGIWYGFFESDGYDSDEELDLYLGISRELGIGTLGLGAIRYIYQDDATDFYNSTELYLSYGMSFNAIDVGAAWYWTVDSEDGADTNGDWYAELTADYNFTLTETLTGEVGVGVSFFDAEFDDGFANYNAHLSLTQEISENIALTPYISFVANDKDYDSDGGKDIFYGGARVSFGF